ncbi:MAG: tRNA pseudouridine(38-40) synthase TruA [Candidatus Binatia bacterium]|nr:tRNA pseudouridine(38-40) synthase TruA [Candidatus Binatia bacterium]
MHLKLTLEYDGTNYHGWQLQRNAVTLQGTIEAVLARLFNEPLRLRVAGRTDAGVHALGQVASFKTTKSVDLPRLHRSLNALLPPDIVVTQVEEVPDSFHPRRDALSRLYCYRIWHRPQPSALWARYAWHVPFPLDLSAMEQAAALLVGEHDFSSFQGADTVAHNPRRTVLHSTVCREDSFVVYQIEARSFLRHMVRNIVGTLVDVGRGALSVADFAHIFAARDRTRAGVTAPPHGLFLVKVTYGYR